MQRAGFDLPHALFGHAELCAKRFQRFCIILHQTRADNDHLAVTQNSEAGCYPGAAALSVNDVGGSRIWKRGRIDQKIYNLIALIFAFCGGWGIERAVGARKPGIHRRRIRDGNTQRLGNSAVYFTCANARLTLGEFSADAAEIKEQRFLR